jgi:AcrR family transcriptional regulator
MSKTDDLPAPTDWREARRQSARDAIVDAAWRLVHAQGLAGLSLRDLAKQAGITTPTVYAYFDSKHAIYDAMFGRAATEFAERMTEPYEEQDPREMLVADVRRFVGFCTTDPVRYQLLFQRTIPGFEPSAESFEPAVRALQSTRERLAANGIRDQRHVDLWTALITGLVAQQISNEPDGNRWIDLVEEATDMFLAHCRGQRLPSRPKTTRTKGRAAHAHQG